VNLQQNRVSQIEQNHSRFGIDTATSKSLMMSRIWKWNPKSVYNVGLCKHKCVVLLSHVQRCCMIEIICW